MALPENPYPTTPKRNAGPLPDLFRAPGMSGRVADAGAWPAAARAWADLILAMEYGGLPPAPDAVRFEEHHRNVRKSWPGSPVYRGFRIICECAGRPFVLGAKLLIPEGPSPCPVIINGDACWPRKVENITAVLARGYGLLIFDRTEAARDIHDPALRAERSGGLYDVFPGRTFGAVSAWAWAYHRCVDLLHSLEGIDRERIAVSGHSRGGKTCLVAGLTDPRITLINDNAGGAGGGALFRRVGDGGETIAITTVFTDWFHPGLRDFIDREADLPFDQHCLLAALAPRPLLLTYALDDRWSNPEGMILATRAARPAYDLFAAGAKLAFHLRSGIHAHETEDWLALLDFADSRWSGRTVATTFDAHPYRHLDGISGSAPSA